MPIFNLKKLNGFVKYELFKMEGFHMMKNVLRPRDFLCKIDIKDAYLCIQIHPLHRKYLSSVPKPPIRFGGGPQIVHKNA